MKDVSIGDFQGDWRGLLSYVDGTGEPVALYWDGRPAGVLLPMAEAAQTIARLRSAARVDQRHDADTAPLAVDAALPTYLDLLRADGTLLPMVDGRRLAFLTMSNTSFVDPQQLYQFRDPRDGTVYVYRADELQAAIGRAFARVEFIPADPRAAAEGRTTER